MADLSHVRVCIEDYIVCGDVGVDGASVVGR